MVKIHNGWDEANILRAQYFADGAHNAVQQVRKYTGEAYIVHPIEVAELVADLSSHPTEDMICAALLHDTVEDTNVTIEDIRVYFSPQIAELVGWLTDVSKPEDGNREVRKKLDKDHFAMAPIEAKTIKLADLISNTRSIFQYDRKFATVYIKEVALLLEVLTEGDPTLYSTAYNQVQECIRIMENDRLQEALAKNEF